MAEAISREITMRGRLRDVAAFSFEAPPSMALAASSITLMTVALVALGPYVRTSRDYQRRWNEAKVAASDVMAKFRQLQQSIDDVRGESVRFSDETLTLANAVHRIQHLRGIVVKAIDDIDLALLGYETLLGKIDALLMHHREQVTMVRPDMVGNLESLRSTFREVVPDLARIRESGAIEQLDEMLGTAIDVSTDYAIMRSLQLAAGRASADPKKAMDALKKVHDFARRHAVKRAG